MAARCTNKRVAGSAPTPGERSHWIAMAPTMYRTVERPPPQCSMFGSVATVAGDASRSPVPPRVLDGRTSTLPVREAAGAPRSNFPLPGKR